MAADELAKGMRKTENRHNIVIVLGHAVLEWILILLLLANSLLSCFIIKFARYFGLEPWCTLCARLNHVLGSDEHEVSSLGHVCEAHGSEISALSYCISHQRLAICKNLCGNCASSVQARSKKQNEVSHFVSFLAWATSEDEGESLLVAEDARCSCCDELLLRRSVLDYMKKRASAEEDDGDQASETTLGSQSSATQREESDELNRDRSSDGFICIEMTDTESTTSEKPPRESSEYSVQECSASVEDATVEVTDDCQGDAITEVELTDDDSLSKEHLRAKIKSQQKALDALYVELEEERKASAISADETMAMITKLQEEKSAMQMEAIQYQRMMEEQAEYDQEALQLLNDLVVKREKEKQELEKELEVYRKKMTVDDDGNHSAGFDSGGEFDESFDSRVQQILTSPVSDISLAEFDEERLSILEDLKALEGKLFALNEDQAGKNFDQKMSNDTTAKKLLPLFDEAKNDGRLEVMEDQTMDQREVCLYEQFRLVYDRLQALEEDKEFFKHCIRSVMKGDKGMDVLQEILQHLRDFRSV